MVGEMDKTKWGGKSVAVDAQVEVMKCSCGEELKLVWDHLVGVGFVMCAGCSKLTQGVRVLGTSKKVELVTGDMEQ